MPWSTTFGAGTDVVFCSVLVRTGGVTRKQYTVRRTILGLYQASGLSICSQVKTLSFLYIKLFKAGDDQHCRKRLVTGAESGGRSDVNEP
jgi:hypothetical protein